VDTIVIDTICPEATIFVPNSFIPDNNGINDVFLAEGSGIISFHLQVYNRWGELLFETYDMSKGWDGTFRKHDCPMDVYIWIINYTGIREHPMIMTGNVTLLR
jgi:gliding motility-associated-like protein